MQDPPLMQNSYFSNSALQIISKLPSKASAHSYAIVCSGYAVTYNYLRLSEATIDGIITKTTKKRSEIRVRMAIDLWDDVYQHSVE